MHSQSKNIKASQQSDLIRVAHLLADAAQSQTLRFFRKSSLNIENKVSLRDNVSTPTSINSAFFDPVTQADKLAEQGMRDVLARERPLDGIIGEEFGQSDTKSGFTWILDPIDGTRAYMCGAPTWGTLIAVQYEGRFVFGMISQPFLSERFIGGLGVAQLQSHAGIILLSTKATTDLSAAFLMSTFPEIGGPEEKQAFDRVSSQVCCTRYGMDCYAYALLALGQIDLVIEAGLQCYDIAAPIAVIEAAGGVVTDWNGACFTNGISPNARIIAAANLELHEQALKSLQP